MDYIISTLHLSWKFEAWTKAHKYLYSVESEIV